MKDKGRVSVLAPQHQARIDDRVRDRRQPAAFRCRDLGQGRGQPIGGFFQPRHALDVVADVDKRFADRVEIDQRDSRASDAKDSPSTLFSIQDPLPVVFSARSAGNGSIAAQSS